MLMPLNYCPGGNLTLPLSLPHTHTHTHTHTHSNNQAPCVDMQFVRKRHIFVGYFYHSYFLHAHPNFFSSLPLCLPASPPLPLLESSVNISHCNSEIWQMIWLPFGIIFSSTASVSPCLSNMFCVCVPCQNLFSLQSPLDGIGSPLTASEPPALSEPGQAFH